MSLPVALFVFFAILLIVLLGWALRPPKRLLHRGDDVFHLLSQPRHCARAPHILRALQPEDTEFLQEIGSRALLDRIRQQRRRIALQYLDQLQEEFELLLEISRALAVMAPEVVAVQEFERSKLSAAFAVHCFFLRLRLRLGLHPLEGFTMLSGMATEMVRHLEAATSQIAEAAVQSSQLPASPKEGADD